MSLFSIGTGNVMLLIVTFHLPDGTTHPQKVACYVWGD